MVEFLRQFSSDQFMPHGMCYLWRPEILWLHVLSDGLIGLSYFSIPAVLLFVARKQNKLVLRKILYLFTAFILLCGFTHFLSIWVIWRPDYAFEGVVKLATAIVSLLTAFTLWPLSPKLLAMPTEAEFKRQNMELKTEIVRRRRAERELQELNLSLEEGIRVRTEDLQKTEVLARDRERKYQASLIDLSAVINTAVDGIIIINDRGVIEIFNTACVHLFGYSADEVIGQNVKLLMPDSYARNHDQYLRNYSETGDAKIIGIGREVVGRRKDGSEFPMHLSVGEMAAGDQCRYVGVIHDITERQEVARQLAANLEELKRSNVDLEQFAYIASHDLQEPLRMVSSYCDLLKKRYGDKLDGDGLEFLDFAVDGATRMRGLIDDLLSYSRVGHENVQLSTFDCQNVIRDVQVVLQASISESGAVVETRSLPKLTAYQPLIHRLFQNLIANSIKFRGDQPPMITITCERVDQKWEFTFSDNGIGIDNKYADRIFRMFQRLHSRSQYPGSGVGLAICRKIVEIHNGSIWLDSSVSTGTTFKFTLGDSR